MEGNERQEEPSTNEGNRKYVLKKKEARKGRKRASERNHRTS